MKKIKGLFLKLWKFIKGFRTWKGLVSFGLVYFLLSGAFLIPLGWVLGIKKLIGWAFIVMAFWALPLTPLLPITFIIARAVQKYVFRDKSLKK